MKNSQSLADNCASRLMGLRRGTGRAHSVVVSPVVGWVISMRCLKMKRSWKDCLAVARTPLATGSAGWPVDSMVVMGSR